MQHHHFIKYLEEKLNLKGLSASHECCSEMRNVALWPLESCKNASNPLVNLKYCSAHYKILCPKWHWKHLHWQRNMKYNLFSPSCFIFDSVQCHGKQMAACLISQVCNHRITILKYINPHSQSSHCNSGTVVIIVMNNLWMKLNQWSSSASMKCKDGTGRHGSSHLF